jgi:hypothetical protein
MGPNKKVNAGMSKKSQKRFRVNWVLDDGSMAPILQFTTPKALLPFILTFGTIQLNSSLFKSYLLTHRHSSIVKFSAKTILKLFFSPVQFRHESLYYYLVVKCQQSIYYVLLYSMSMANL